LNCVTHQQVELSWYNNLVKHPPTTVAVLVLHNYSSLYNHVHKIAAVNKPTKQVESVQSSMRSGGGPHGCNMRSMQLNRTRAFVSFSAIAK